MVPSDWSMTWNRIHPSVPICTAERTTSGIPHHYGVPGASSTFERRNSGVHFGLSFQDLRFRTNIRGSAGPVPRSFALGEGQHGSALGADQRRVFDTCCNRPGRPQRVLSLRKGPARAVLSCPDGRCCTKQHCKTRRFCICLSTAPGDPTANL